MNFAIIRNDLLNILDKQILTKDNIITFVNDIVNFLGIGEYLKKIRFLPDDYEENEIPLDRDNLSTYSFINRIMKINIENIKQEAISYYDRENDDELILFINMNIIECLLHEITHVFQNYAIHETNYSIFKLMHFEISAFEFMSDKDYDTYYYTLLFERDAIITTYENLMIIAKVLLKNEALYEYYKENLGKVLLGGYKVKYNKVTSPLETKYKKLFKKEVPIVTAANIYETFKYGFPVNINEYNNFRLNEDEIILKKISCM